MATPTDIAEIARKEDELNNQRNQAFLSMVRMGHVSPSVAKALATIYRAALTCNTYVRQQAENQEVDTLWLYFLYSVGAFSTLGFAQMGMNLGAKLIGMAKYLMVIPVLGIPIWKMFSRRNIAEIVEFFSEKKKDRKVVRVVGAEETVKKRVHKRKE